MSMLRRWRAKTLCWESFHFRHFSFYFGVHLSRLLDQFAWCFFPLLRCSRFGCFLQLLLFGWLLQERSATKVCSQCLNSSTMSVEIFKISQKYSNLAAVSSTDLQFRLFARCCYGNQLWDFFLLRLFLLSLCSCVCLICVLFLVLLCLLFGCRLLKFTNTRAGYFPHIVSMNQAPDERLGSNWFSPFSWESEVSLPPPALWGRSGLPCRWAGPLTFDSLNGWASSPVLSVNRNANLKSGPGNSVH